MFSVDAFESHWPELAASFRYFAEVDSTNDTALLYKKEDGAVILSERQRAGRGRGGSQWYSERERSLTFSLVVHSRLPLSKRPRLALGAGLAITRVLEQQRLLAQIKWPNDVLIGERKICGVLVEAFGEGAIVGIGVNIERLQDVPELQRDATSLVEEAGTMMEREWLLGAFVQQCRSVLADCERDFPSVVTALNQRLAWKDEQVSFVDQYGDSQTAVIREIAADGSLAVEQDGRLQQIYSAGEIQVVNS